MRSLLIAACFPPAIGGSGELLFQIYSRLPHPVHVISGEAKSPAGLPPGMTVEHRAFPTGLGIAAPRSMRGHFSLARTIRGAADAGTVVHCARAQTEGTAAWLSSPSGRRPFTCWTHGEEIPIARSSRELSWLLARVHRSASALFANSHNTARLLLELGNPADRVHVVHPGVDAGRFMNPGRSADFRRHLAGDDLVLLSVGRLQTRKGHDLVLKALAGWPADAPAMRYVVVGDGPESMRLHALAESLGVRSRVTFVGAVPVDDLPRYYGAADIFVHPNRVDGGDFEGFGIVFLEAAAARLPTIGGRSGGVPEAIAEGETGVLVNGMDVDELRQALLRLARSPAERERLGEAGRRRVLSDFTWDRAARQVTAVEHDIVERARHRA